MVTFRCAGVVFAWAAAMSCSGSGSGSGAAVPTSPGSDCEPGRCLDDIARVVKERRAEARACYDAKPGLEAGRIIINFVITPDGTVTEPEPSVKEGQLTDVEVIACISDVVKELTFPASPAGKRTRAYHTFEFANRGAK
ncbi:MAG: AgmX/PglI C-terminal domain-containing protein [Deltaproteobacteria bacterium]|nr:AgmX/PglI C-terminal domain-containing protein [Deltaproteobacteria bacterium]